MFFCLSLAMDDKDVLWCVIASAAVVLIVTQCTPAVGCWGEQTHTAGRHLGFTIGSDRGSAATVVASTYNPQWVHVWRRIENSSSTVTDLAKLKTLEGPTQWRFENRRRPYCSADRNVVLTFEGGRLFSIKDELSVTLP